MPSDGFSRAKYELVEQFDCWCYTKQTQADLKRLEFGAEQGTELRQFVIGFHEGLAANGLFYVLSSNKLYKATRVDAPEDYRVDMFVYGERDTTEDFINQLGVNE